MADVDMTDAPASAPATKKKGGAAADGDSKGEPKKRFEVKKVDCYLEETHFRWGLTVSRSGTPWLFGPGTSLSTTAPSAETTSWTFVRLLNAHLLNSYGSRLTETQALNARPTKHLRPVKSAQLLGAFAMYVLSYKTL